MPQPVARDEESRKPAASGSPDSKTAQKGGVIRALGLGIITGAADDDPSAIGTYAIAGAKFGPMILWLAPVTLPLMFAVVYLSAKLGQVTGRGLFAALRKRYGKGLLYPTLICVVIGNVIEAGADLGGIAAALRLLIPIPMPVLVLLTAVAILVVQIWGSYAFMRNVFRILALTLLAYIPAALLAKPDLLPVIRGTFIPAIKMNREFLTTVVAIIGTTLSAYLYTWQSNEEVEEEKAQGRITIAQRRGASESELQHSRRDIFAGIVFSNVAMYFIMLAAAATLFKTGKTEVTTAADVAQSLQPLAGRAATFLFAAGIIGVGFLAVPIMTGGAAYDICQTLGWKYGLDKRPAQAKRFYWVIVALTAVAAGMNFLGINPMRALFLAGIVQGFSTPPLMLFIMLLTNSKEVMGERTNGWAINVLGWVTTGAIFAATLGLVVTWII
jgi:NRAMP (natural resistance-associated macrophage protein)-like metal ion transporter